MYSIQDDATTGLIRISLSGRVPTAEAARAVSQAFALAEAGGRQLLLCDLREVTRGPEEPAVLVSLVRAGAAANLRFAFVGNGKQLRMARKVAHEAGIGLQSGVFTRLDDATAWLAGGAQRKHSRMSGTERRHAEHLLGGAADEDVEPRRRGSAA